MTQTLPSLQTTLDASCAHLESTAASMGVKLRRDTSSVQDLEEILVAVRDMGADKPALDGASFMVGVYLGEILRVKLGGTWRKSTDGDLLLEVEDATYAPVIKARKFVANPDGPDGLVFFAQAALAGHV